MGRNDQPRRGPAAGPAAVAAPDPLTLVARWTGLALSAGGFAALLIGWLAGGGSADLPWAPAMGIRLAFELDGLAALYGMLATGVGFFIFAYSSRYIPLHLAHAGRPPREEARFHGLILLFMVSMVGLVTAQDMILLFIFWDLTAVASYLLIGYDRAERESRASALMALLVTGVSALLLLIAALVGASVHGTFSLPELFDAAAPGATATLMGSLIAAAGLAKCAQVPLHFWLPRAMAAPTPVSAYLHSAAMVAAGVFLLARLHPLIALDGALLAALAGVGLASTFVAGLIALTRDTLKQLLAYSTIAQYGYVVFLLGLGGEKGAAAAAFYVLAHAPAKSALFLASGAVSEATGETALSRLGGLGRRMPVLAAASGVAAAGLAALPLTIGFFKDELYFGAAVEAGAGYAVATVAAAAITLAYSWRFWSGVFLGPERAAPRAIPATLVWPVVAMAGVVALGGVLVRPFVRLAADAAAATLRAPVSLSASYHLDLRAENVMAIATYLGGALLIATRARWLPLPEALARLGERLGPERAYAVTLGGLNRFSNDIHRFEARDLRDRVASVLLPAGALVIAGLIASPVGGVYEVGAFRADDFWLILALVAASGAALATTIPRHHLTLVLIFSCVGLSLALAYAFFGAPDVALVAALIELTFALLLLGVLALVPPRVLRREQALASRRSRRIRDPLVALVAGGVAFAVAWGALSSPTPDERIADRHIELTPSAHGSDVVTVILADFRGLDTLVEITVVLIALLGIVTLLGLRRSRP